MMKGLLRRLQLQFELEVTVTALTIHANELRTLHAEHSQEVQLHERILK
jgi:hypothetical protein